MLDFSRAGSPAHVSSSQVTALLVAAEFGANCDFGQNFLSKSVMFTPRDSLHSIDFGSNHVSEMFKSIDFSFEIKRLAIRIFREGLHSCGPPDGVVQVERNDTDHLT
jgi:hypothetical protein